MKGSKPILKSKTFWFNTLFGAGGVVQIIAPFLGPQGVAIAAVVSAVGNIVLRKVTDQPVTFK